MTDDEVKAALTNVRCRFCGKDVIEGFGGHTSSCYERMVNDLKAHIEAQAALLKRCRPLVKACTRMFSGRLHRDAAALLNDLPT